MGHIFTVKMREKAKAVKSIEELLSVAKENGIELTAAQAKEYYDKLNKTGELSDDELDNVAGGGCSESERGSGVPAEYEAAFVAAGKNDGTCPICGNGIVKKDEFGFPNCNENYCIIYCTACHRSCKKKPYEC